MPIEDIAGTVLIWTSITPDGRRATMERYGFADVLGLDQMVADLVVQRPAERGEYIDARRRACDDLFDVITVGPDLGLHDDLLSLAPAARRLALEIVLSGHRGMFEPVRPRRAGAARHQ